MFGESQSHEKRNQSRDKSSNGSGNSDIKQCGPRADCATNANECAHGPSQAQERDDVRQRGPNAITSTVEVVPHFVAEQDCEQRGGKWDSKGKSGRLTHNPLNGEKAKDALGSAE